MALSFPTNPVHGQEYTSASRAWVFNSSKGAWDAKPVPHDITPASIGALPAVNGVIINPTEAGVSIGVVGATHTLDISAGTIQTATLPAGGACAFVMPAPAEGKSFVLYLKQAAVTGGGTATFPGVKWPFATPPAITATAGRMDILSFVSDGANWYGSSIQNFTP